MAIPKRTRSSKGSVDVVTAKWTRSFNIVYLTILQKYVDIKEENGTINIPVDTLFQVASGIALRLVEIADGDDS